MARVLLHLLQEPLLPRPERLLQLYAVLPPGAEAAPRQPAHVHGDDLGLDVAGRSGPLLPTADGQDLEQGPEHLLAVLHRQPAVVRAKDATGGKDHRGDAARGDRRPAQHPPRVLVAGGAQVEAGVPPVEGVLRAVELREILRDDGSGARVHAGQDVPLGRHLFGADAALRALAPPVQTDGADDDYYVHRPRGAALVDPHATLGLHGRSGRLQLRHARPDGPRSVASHALLHA
mmetsp:Transcript_61948/g.191986  ORF Transcript_61948/g.191986 Transcript_61948/m.191986 type:complete len:233 (+) Transcript_61948:2093-2791(+)